MKIAAFVLMAAACSSSGKDTDKASPTGGGMPDQSSVSGNLVLSGALSGTFHWKSDLAVTCTWVAETKVGEISVTMTDDTNFIAVRVMSDGQHTQTTLTSAALKAPVLESSSGATITGTDLNHASARLDTEAVSKDGSTKVAIKGTIAGACR